ncbi:ribonuclease H-like domain-containing protein [Tanacetum coccineum]
MHDPREPHFAALKHILRYVRRNVDFGLQLYVSATIFSSVTTEADWQHTISRSSAEAEYQGVANVVAETAWVRNLLRELHSPLMTAHLSTDDTTNSAVRVLHVPSRFQYADIFTKGLPSALFEEFDPD